jgi:hypothetical protein
MKTIADTVPDSKKEKAIHIDLYYFVFQRSAVFRPVDG